VFAYLDCPPVRLRRRWSVAQKSLSTAGFIKVTNLWYGTLLRIVTLLTGNKERFVN
jgi:hypothetical protein